MTSRMLYLLGELKREMNGAVASAMRFYGAEYGLNYGVSIPTIRALARSEEREHRFAKYLYQQDIRELKLLSLWLAEPSQLNTPEKLRFWAQGIINSELAEEAAFALLFEVDSIEAWLNEESELLQYCAVMSLANAKQIDFARVTPQLQHLLSLSPSLLPKGIVALLESVAHKGDSESVNRFIESLPHNKSCAYIRDEMSWRI